MKIRELIEVPPVKTVIQMSDIKDPEIRSFLTESFLLTDETRGVLESFFGSLSRQEGKGFFLEGNYGSGKSHLLTVISLLLTCPESWQPILQQVDASADLLEYQKVISARNYLVVNLSLVEHSNRERLEDIINSGIIDALRNDQAKGKELPESPVNRLMELTIPENDYYRRKEYYSILTELLAGGTYQGIIFLIDELSEFLRSKPDGRSFNEDIRFLQFLGEFSAREYCWLIATLQEAIEKTGEITQEVFGKIKDRFPARFHLTGTHIREIVSKRLIKIKPGAREKISDIYQYYAEAFSNWSVGKEEFISLYPVNPLAISLLDNLKPLFSQHRGIIDFIHYRLKGDSSRNMPGMLTELAERLLNPDLIFDHFLDRIRETMETRGYYEKVYQYYQQELPSILSEDEVDTGLRLIKLLILFAISPVEKKYNVRTITHMLLKPVTELESGVNYEYIDDLLQRMYRHGAYLVFENSEEPGGNSYSLDLKADVNLIIQQKTEYIKSNFFKDEQRLFTGVGRLVEENYLPLKGLLEQPRSVRRVYWQKTERQGYLCLLPLTDISLKAITEFTERLKKPDFAEENGELKDFVILIGYPLEIAKQQQYLKEVIMPELDGEEQTSFCFWLPAELEGKGFLKDILARQLLLMEYQEKTGETATAITRKLQMMLNDDRKNVVEFFREAYFSGSLIDGNGETVLDLVETGILSFKQLLEKIVAILLERRFPDHVNIAPYHSTVNDSQLNRLCQDFLEAGEADRQLATGKGLMNIIENSLNPMGLVKTRGKAIILKVNPGTNPLLKEFFSLLEEERTHLDYIYLNLRKGRYGLTWPEFKVLVMALLYSGYITAYSDRQKIALSQLNAFNFNRIKYLGYGEIIDPVFQEVLANCSLLPPRFKNQPFSLPLQQDIWDYLVEVKREMVEEVRNLKVKLTDLTLDNKLSYTSQEQFLKTLERVEQLLEEVKVSYSAEEGLERFASSYQSLPNIDSYLERYHKLRVFFYQQYNTFLEIKNYLDYLPEELPDRGKFIQVKEHRKELEEALQDQAVIFNEGFFDGLVESFNSFRRLYAEVYYSEHERKLSGERFRLYRQLEESKDYQVLARLAEIEMVSVKDDLIKVDRLLARVLRQECNRLKREYLYRHPLCSCGFKPADQLESIPVQEIHRVISRGIAQYLATLGSSSYRSRIEQYLTEMEAVGEKRFARPIRELLLISSRVTDEVNSDDLVKLDQLLNRNLIKRINQALEGSIKLLERNLDQLYENLVGRCFSIEQLQQIFDDWLKTDTTPEQDTYIKVVAEEKRPVIRYSPESNNNSGNICKEEAEDILEGFLTEYYPELLRYYDHTGEEGFSLLMALLYWKNRYNLNIGDLTQDIIPSEDIIELSGRINPDTVYNFWDSIPGQGGVEPLDKRIRGNVERLTRQNNLLEQLIKLLPLGDLDQIISILEREFISYELIKKLITIFVKRTENGLSARGSDLLLKRIEKTLASTTEKKKIIYLELIKNYLQLQSSFSHLEGGKVPETAAKWSCFYRDYLAGLDYSLSRLKQLAQETGMVASLPLKVLQDKVKKLQNKYLAEFFKFGKENLFRIKEEAIPYFKREEDTRDRVPDLPSLLLEGYPELVKSVNSEQNYCILMDGMRSDNWELIKKELSVSIACRVIREGQLYSGLPTNTETQLERLREAGFSGEIISPEEVIINNEESSKDLFIKKQPIPGEIIKFTYIDDKIHTSRDNYSGLMEELLFQTRNKLVPFIQQLPARSTILIISDHGYRLNQQYQPAEKYEHPRYLHGGGTPYEVIVPWALLYKV